MNEDMAFVAVGLLVMWTLFVFFAVPVMVGMASLLYFVFIFSP